MLNGIHPNQFGEIQLLQTILYWIHPNQPGDPTQQVPTMLQGMNLNQPIHQPMFLPTMLNGLHGINLKKRIDQKPQQLPPMLDWT